MRFGEACVECYVLKVVLEGYDRALVEIIVYISSLLMHFLFFAETDVIRLLITADGAAHGLDGTATF